MRCLVRIYRSQKSYSAMVPDLPGCIATGDSVEDARELISEAIYLHLDLMRKSGEPIPAPVSHFDIDDDEVEENEWVTWVRPKRRKPMRR
jgi:predicted RNase H-like HicB family nuclease